MTQITSPKSKRRATKISVPCFMLTMFVGWGIAISTMFLFHRLAFAKREPLDPQQPTTRISRQSPMIRKTRQEMELESYMKTGRRPQHVDTKFSDRHIEGNAFERREDKPVRQVARKVRKEEPEESDAFEGHRHHLPEKHDNPSRNSGQQEQKPKEKKTHFYHDKKQESPEESHHEPDHHEPEDRHELGEHHEPEHHDADEHHEENPHHSPEEHHSPEKHDEPQRHEEKHQEDAEEHANADTEEHHEAKEAAVDQAVKEEFQNDELEKLAKEAAVDKEVKEEFQNDVLEKLSNHWKHAKNLQVPDGPPALMEGFDDPIHWIDYTQVSRQDTFSASWLQRREEFMEMPFSQIQICEDAAWEAWDERPEKLRMTLDYMDFSVEHLSKWWKFLSFYNTPVAYNSIIRVLTEYIKRGDQFPDPPLDEMMMPNTLSMIAFQPYLHKKESERHYNLTVTSLAATLESIRRAQIGRVVVVGLVDNGYDIAQESFRYLADHVPGVTHQANSKGIVTKIGHLEVGYARGDAVVAKSKHLVKNIPRAVLYGTKLALELGDRPASERKANETAYVNEWLGDEHSPKYWKYLYLTEPDTLLNARPNAIKQIKAQLDQGNVLAPHRLQPIPHESDLKGLANRFRYLNEDNGFDNVWEIDETKDVCCDEHKGPDARPRTNFPECGTWWYMCGFKQDYTNKKLGDVHMRLRPYSLMKLKGGTGLTLMAGNLFGRRCFPAKDTKCLPPAP